ncbi:MAG: PqqD family protein [Oscillospiraceae bacterium]|nr:PqqD family protein [Oscillospiraceae bacterium]
MKKKKIVIERNYLEKIPVRAQEIKWSADENGIVTLEIENKGWANVLAQKLLKRPRISYVHLDENGSFVWPLIDGEKDILALGELVKAHFGEKAEPLYERLARYFQILDSYHFINWIKS